MLEIPFPEVYHGADPRSSAAAARLSPPADRAGERAGRRRIRRGADQPFPSHRGPLPRHGPPAVVVCQDEMAARRTQSELAAFLGAEAPILPTRDLMFYDASAISRGWEQQRLRCLCYDLARGKTPLLLTTLEAFSLRTMPRRSCSPPRCACCPARSSSWTS